jgi:hypothetical protein
MPLIFVLEFETAVYDEAPRTWVKRVRQHVQYRLGGSPISSRRASAALASFSVGLVLVDGNLTLLCHASLRMGRPMPKEGEGALQVVVVF